MKKQVILAVVGLVASLTQAAPYLSEQLRLRAVVVPSQDLGIAGSTMYNPRFFDGKIYANQINIGVACFGRYPIGSTLAEMLVNSSSDNALEHRMVAPFRGANKSAYILGSGSASGPATKFTRYNYDGTSPLSIDAPDLQLADSFDWVDESTIIYSDYTSGNRKRLCLASVVAEPFSVTVKPTWNVNGYITTSVSTRIRNIRVGEVYSGYAYYGDAGQNTNPNFYAVNLATGAETLLGNLGALTGTGSFGLWTVVERGGFLYVQTTDNGIFVYPMTSPTTIGPLHTTYTKSQLDAVTGGAAQYFGLDLTSGGSNLLLGGLAGQVFQLGGAGVPYLGEDLQRRVTVNPSADIGTAGNSMFNPRLFDDKVYANQINNPCFGRYPWGSNIPEVLVTNIGTTTLEHRMVAPFRGANRFTYMMGSSHIIGGEQPTFTRYDWDGFNPISTYTADSLAAAGWDWVDNDTIIYTVYTPTYRTRLCLADVVAEPFSIAFNTTWNPNGYVETSVTTRIRNVRVGDVYRGYAYYGDAGQNNNPKFYAINLATGAETELGSLPTLTGSGSFGLWTAVERDGYLYVQTTDNGVYVYKMTDATTLGPLYTTYTKAQLDAATGGSTQYFGWDAAVDGKRLLIGGLQGNVYELQGRPSLAISRSGASVQLSWSASVAAQVLQSATSLSAGDFSDVTPQPPFVQDGELTKASVSIGSTTTFFRLRKGP